MVAASSSLKEYLKRYENNNEEEKKKNKKKKKAAKAGAAGVVVVDEDPVWQKQVEPEEENDDSEDEEKPLVDEDIEVKRMKRLEELRGRRPFGAISEDGSGWVPISDNPKSLDSNDQNSDMSPPRKRKARNDTPSPEPEAKHPNSTDQNYDISPPRKRRARYDTPSPEPEPELRHLEFGRESADLSPPRHQRRRHRSRSVEHKTNKTKRSQKQFDEKNSEVSDLPDISPPRRGHRRSANRDNSRASPIEDLSPPRRTGKDLTGSRDLSPWESSRRTTDSVSDLSPPRKSRKQAASLKERPKTGLISGQDIKEEIAKTQKDAWLRFKEMDPSVSGRGAEPVYRDKLTGERISKDQLLKSTKKEEKPKEIKVEWGKGLAQKREAEARQQELELEKDKPFARTRDDADLDKMMKERVRWGDPMAHLVKKKQSEHVLRDLGDNEEMKESGFIIPQDIPSHSWLKRGLDVAPNRYGIRPGRHWDGVDRSNGFEKELINRTNEKQATEREAYLWSVSDM